MWLSCRVTFGILLKWLCLVLGVSGFNLDLRIPIIKSAGNVADNYFGYSVAQHRTLPGAKGEPRFLVGAPLDQNLQPGTNRSGALWQCSLSNEIQVSQRRSQHVNCVLWVSIESAKVWNRGELSFQNDTCAFPIIKADLMTVTWKEWNPFM